MSTKKNGPRLERGPPVRTAYLLVPELLLPVEPLVLPEPVALGELLEELGELEDELPAPVAPEDELPLMPDELEDGEADEPLELELKCLSHSEREIVPSLLVSTDEKLGWVMLELEPDVPPAAPVDELPLEDDDGEADEPLEALSPAAMARDDRAKSAAAVVTVTVFSI